MSPRYDGRCRTLEDYKSCPGDAALRFKAPQEGQIVVDDLIKGQDHVFDNTVRADDLIILRSNGYPTYNFLRRGRRCA